jgi:hypothetical protein
VHASCICTIWTHLPYVYLCTSTRESPTQAADSLQHVTCCAAQPGARRALKDATSLPSPHGKPFLFLPPSLFPLLRPLMLPHPGPAPGTPVAPAPHLAHSSWVVSPWKPQMSAPAMVSPHMLLLRRPCTLQPRSCQVAALSPVQCAAWRPDPGNVDLDTALIMSVSTTRLGQ